MLMISAFTSGGVREKVPLRDGGQCVLHWCRTTQHYLAKHQIFEKATYPRFSFIKYCLWHVNLPRQTSVWNRM